uniref:Uncharacterized protein n=1 Tax=Panagrolaimus davidi TaxID=227884 RepID=A0A914QKP2_9BILA
MYSSSSYKDNRRSYDNDIDPIYQEQNVVMRNSQQSSNDEYGTGNQNRRSGSGGYGNDTSANRRSTDNVNAQTRLKMSVKLK